MKKLICILISLLCIASLLCACSDKNQPSSETPSETQSTDEAIPVIDANLVGTWIYADAKGNALPEMKGWIFNEDGTGVDTVFDLTFKYDANNGILDIRYDDTTLGAIEAIYEYSIDNSLLTMRRNVQDAETFTYMKDISEQK